MTGMAALPAALRALADALDDALSGPRLTVVPASDVDEPERLCRWCHHPMPHSMRIDAEYCSTLCRKAAWRRRTGRS